MFSDDDMNAIYEYILWNDEKFEELTEGPRHRNLILSLMADKKSNDLMRERLIAKFLGLNHNNRMHSTTNGITTFDAVHPMTNLCYEIKTEQHTSNNAERSTQNGQLNGAGAFSSIRDIDGINKLISDNPIIAHGMFGDGRLLSLSTFKLSESNAITRISKYHLNNSKTTPKYAFTDWIDIPTLKIEYVSEKWPAHIAPKYRKIFFSKWQSNLQSIVLPDQHLTD